ncbi:MAG TPA: hypothetical protein QGG32_05565 [Rhodospirillales bacterium]|nr:hypothetical protein [Rhodospirillales bacterium]
MLGGIALLVLSVIATAKDASVFINWPGLLIVLGGTVAATLMSFPLREVLRVFKVFVQAEDVISNLRNPILRTGL